MSEGDLTAGVGVWADHEPWAAELACPAGVPIRKLIELLIDLRCILKSLHPAEDDEFCPDAYWPTVTHALHDVLRCCEAIQTELSSCRPWISVVVTGLIKILRQAAVWYRLDDAEVSGKWPAYPLHQDQCATLDRLCYALVSLPDVKRWRPVDAAKRAGSNEQIDLLIAKTVAKVFDEYKDDDEQLTWGTVETLQRHCDVLLEARRDAGYFGSRAPTRIREIRLLADRLGCEELALSFEEEDTTAAFGRSVSGLGRSPWSVESDNEVRQWLKRILDWCEFWLTDGAIDVADKPTDDGEAVEKEAEVSEKSSNWIHQPGEQPPPAYCIDGDPKRPCGPVTGTQAELGMACHVKQVLLSDNQYRRQLKKSATGHIPKVWIRIICERNYEAFFCSKQLADQADERIRIYRESQQSDAKLLETTSNDAT